MNMLGEYGKEDLAKVYVASMRGDNDHFVEFVESIQPPIPREKKWVLIVSSLFGCPVRCQMCDAGREYRGKLTTAEILEQIHYMVRRCFPDGKIPIPKFKIQFARMGEPSLNPNVLDVLEKLPEIYEAHGLTPAISTVAPAGTNQFFDRLIEIKNRFYSQGRFQLQFSIHTTDREKRDGMIPVKKWDFVEISKYGKRFFKDGDRKVTLNFAAARDYPVDPKIVRENFDPDKFIIKLTPLNPTTRVRENKLVSTIDPFDPHSAEELVDDLHSHGFEVILSIGEVEENRIGSNCGQFVTVLRNSSHFIQDNYETQKYRIH